VSSSSALTRWIDAYNSGNAPSPSTWRAALAELDALIDERQESLRGLCVLRGRVEGMRGMQELEDQVLAAVRSPAAVVAAPAPRLVTDCIVCGEREARVWDEVRGYCKRCAHQAGVLPHGKIV